jgi:hypothetical protein
MFVPMGWTKRVAPKGERENRVYWQRSDGAEAFALVEGRPAKRITRERKVWFYRTRRSHSNFGPFDSATEAMAKANKRHPLRGER